MGGERRSGIDCLRMRHHSPKNLGIRLRLEIVGTYTNYFRIVKRYSRLPVEVPSLDQECTG